MGNQSPEEAAKLKKDVRADFDKIDTDKSGLIDKEEFRKLIEKIAQKQGTKIKEEEVEKTFNQFDKDKSGKISFDEVFANWAAFGVLIGLAGK